jgi:putative spermidine/putrescine transport system substrate-binding protein
LKSKRALLQRIKAAAGLKLMLHLVAAAVMALSLPAFATTHLRILAWPGYADSDLVAEFEQQAGVRVHVSYVNSDDELWEKINRNKGSDFDLFAVNTAELQRYMDHGLVTPIDMRRIPNHANQLLRFRALDKIPGIVRGGQIYAVPYTYSEMGLIYNRKLVREPPQSMAAMWDPAYRGKVLAHNTSNHNFSVAALLAGVKNPFRLSEQELRAAARKLVGLRRNVRAFYGSPEEAVKLYLEQDIALVFANYGAQQLTALRQAGADVGYIIPREGALAWLDCWVITSAARDSAKAASWINFTLGKKVSDALTERQGLGNTVTPFPDSDPKDKIIWLEPLEDFKKRNELWNRIMSGDGLEKL